MAFIHNTIAVTGLPQQITGIAYPTLFNYARFFGYSSYSNTGQPNNNTAVTYVGLTSGNYLINIPTGSSTTLELPGNVKENLSNLWIKGNANDGVSVLYY